MGNGSTTIAMSNIIFITKEKVNMLLESILKLSIDEPPSAEQSKLVRCFVILSTKVKLTIVSSNSVDTFPF